MKSRKIDKASQISLAQPFASGGAQCGMSIVVYKQWGNIAPSAGQNEETNLQGEELAGELDSKAG